MYKAIERLMILCNTVAKEHGWWEHNRPFGELIALMHSELSEALEAYRAGAPYDKILYDDITKSPEGIAVELADAVIRILDVCSQYSIPLAHALKVKIKYNKTRSYRLGNKKI